MVWASISAAAGDAGSAAVEGLDAEDDGGGGGVDSFSDLAEGAGESRGPAAAEGVNGGACIGICAWAAGGVGKFGRFIEGGP